jgi:hypothetical protein
MVGQQNQISIERIELMPNEPAPYNVRNWHVVAARYDSFVYDVNHAGQYLPLITIQPSGVNYPGNTSFGMHSYVGTGSLNAGEAINILPSLVGATLNGINKQDQFGNDWVLMSQDYFGRSNGEDIYVNNRGGHSGSDWWYDVMPNVYFYQLYDLYGEMGDAGFQFTRIADRFLEAVRAMGGTDTPWDQAFMDYRAWNFIEMQPNASGVHEPEAAGTFAWILYQAYVQTGRAEYLKGAEWSMEFLDGLNSNPSYELQLPYGVSIAARMNAELLTAYDLEKLTSWVFDRGPIRGWGTIVGKWGGLDVSGLVGEANDQGNDYAFQLNGVQQAAALVPLVRYDKRYSRAIGKWFLNLANATRLMFPRFLPAAYQDASDWSDINDPQAVMGYEALREQHNGFSPFSTGDALGGGWAATNLALYGTSSIGYLGALFQETNVNKILMIDLVKTDFFGSEAYPSYLLFNPFLSAQEVVLFVGDDPVDIYDAISETFLLQNVNGNVNVTIPADEALSLVFAPANGMISYVNNKMLIDQVVVDYAQHAESYNASPRIKALGVADIEVALGDTTTLYGTSVDPELTDLTYLWDVTGGALLGQGAEVRWIAPQNTGPYDVTLIVLDAEGLSDTAVITIQAVTEVNVAPVIHDLSTGRQYVEPDVTVSVTCIADDLNGDTLTYTWSASDGVISGSGGNVFWTSPPTEGLVTISVEVSDDKGAVATEELIVLVHTFVPGSGTLIAHYPYDGGAQDVSGNDLHGDVFGAKLTEDRFGNTSSAYNFDGINDHITVSNTQLLNFTEGITVSCWIRPITLPDRETFIVSHGSWQNRWKISITPDRYLRWTIKNVTGQVVDVDSKTQLVVGRDYHVAVSYDGDLVLVYLDGRLESIGTMSGALNMTTIDLEIGQILPDVQTFNFRGILDDIKIYDYALHPDTISGSVSTSTDHIAEFSKPVLYPNPTSGELFLDIGAGKHSNDIVSIVIYDQSGRRIRAALPGWSGEQLKLNTNDLGPGIFYVELQYPARSQTIRFVKLE